MSIHRSLCMAMGCVEKYIKSIFCTEIFQLKNSLAPKSFRIIPRNFVGLLSSFCQQLIDILKCFSSHFLSSSIDVPSILEALVVDNEVKGTTSLTQSSIGRYYGRLDYFNRR